MSINTIYQSTVPIITIDGPSGAGKGTVSAKVARHLGWHFLDSGAIYRCLAYVAQQHGLATDDVVQLTYYAARLCPRFIAYPLQESLVWLNDEDITQVIRKESIGRIASLISKHEPVRNALLDCQRKFAQQPGLVADGRDMGTLVFPDAALKLFLDAKLEERARRRYHQLQARGETADLLQITEELQARDQRDRERSIAPLQAASDALVIDTTDMSIEEVVEKVLACHHAVFIERQA